MSRSLPSLFSLIIATALSTAFLSAADVPPIPASAEVPTGDTRQPTNDTTLLGSEEPISIPMETAIKVGKRVWLNETGGKPAAITSWNRGEDFASLGIGHFIWFAGRPEPFEESFPPMVRFLQNMRARLPVPIPAWLDKTPIPPCPWKDKADFDSHIDSPRMVELRKFLDGNFGPQTLFLVQRMKEALPRIEASLDKPEEREHVRFQFYRVAHSSRDLYPLIDYINFKGEGINPSETYPDADTKVPEGWGLKQVLLEMHGTEEGQAALDEYSQAAQTMLKRRIRNNPANARWEKNWLERCASYKTPLP